MDTFNRHPRIDAIVAIRRRTIAVYAPREFIGAWSRRTDSCDTALPGRTSAAPLRRDWTLTIAYGAVLVGGTLMALLTMRLFP